MLFDGSQGPSGDLGAQLAGYPANQFEAHLVECHSDFRSLICNLHDMCYSDFINPEQQELFLLFVSELRKDGFNVDAVDRRLEIHNTFLTALQERNAAKGDSAKLNSKKTVDMRTRGSMYRNPDRTASIMRETFPNQFDKAKRRFDRRRERRDDRRFGDDSASVRSQRSSRTARSSQHDKSRSDRGSDRGGRSDRHRKSRDGTRDEKQRFRRGGDEKPRSKQSRPVKLSDLGKYADGLTEMSREQTSDSFKRRLSKMAAKLKQASMQDSVYVNQAGEEVTMVDEDTYSDFLEGQQHYNIYFVVNPVSDVADLGAHAQPSDDDDLHSDHESHVSHSTRHSTSSSEPEPDGLGAAAAQDF